MVLKKKGGIRIKVAGTFLSCRGSHVTALHRQSTSACLSAYQHALPSPAGKGFSAMPPKLSAEWCTLIAVLVNSG
jgi:hypothetical protein